MATFYSLIWIVMKIHCMVDHDKKQTRTGFDYREKISNSLVIAIIKNILQGQCENQTHLFSEVHSF